VLLYRQNSFKDCDMNPRKRDISGQFFGRLTALSPDGKIGAATAWLFRCSCGTEKRIRMTSVTSGVVNSCGCLHKERCASGLNARRHGDARSGKVSRLHNIWRGMLKRCVVGAKHHSGAYAERGIGVCADWKEYEAFRAWSLSNGYGEGLTIDRKDNDGGYAPSNCRWVDRKTQARNRRTSRWITINGETLVLAEWLERAGISAPTFYKRVRQGRSDAEAILGKRYP
jgi:hypothetical protein